MQKKSWIYFALATLAIVAALFYFLTPEKSPTPAVSVDRPKAFLGAAWGMSPEEVEAANQVKLSPTQSARKLFTAGDDLEDKNRYLVLDQPISSFLNRDATVSYVFVDRQLFSYHVFVRDADGQTLDSDMRSYLIEKYGNDGSVNEDESSLKMIWHERDVIVNYWFFREDLTLLQKYSAGFGVVYRALEDKVRR